MRRRRHQLQVSTFPFLAVLLCAMGALILLLLVIDRRAKAVAKSKAQETLAQHLEEQQRRLRERQAELEEQQRQRLALLDDEKRELERRLAGLLAQVAAGTEALQVQEAQTQDVAKKLLQERTGLTIGEQQLASERALLGKREQLTEKARVELQRQMEEVRQLETALAGLRLLRQREQQTYSLVPYRGKRGDNRKPIYIECSGKAISFYPDGLALEGLALNETRLRQEVVTRMVGQTEKLSRDKKEEPRAYLLLLVRPDGIPNYYHLQASVAGLPVDFGYEFVDADWILAFDDDGERQPWQKAAVAQGTGKLTPSGPPRPAFSQGGPFPPGNGQPAQPGAGGSTNAKIGFGPVGSVPGTGNSGTGNSGGGEGELRVPPLVVGPAGTKSGIGPQGSGSGTGGGVSWNPSAGTGTAGGGADGQPGIPRIGVPGVPTNAGKTGGTVGVAPGGVALTPNGPGQGSGGGEPGDGQGGINSGNSATGVGNKGNGELGKPDFPPRPSESPNVAGNPRIVPGAASSGQEAGDKGPFSNQPDQGNQSGGNQGGGSQQGGSQGGGKQPGANQPGGNQPGGGQPESGQQIGQGQPGQEGEGSKRIPPGVFSDPNNRMPPTPIGRLTGNRDWIIALECRENELFLRNTGKHFPLVTFTDQRTVETTIASIVRDMIARRQATVRPGDPPYRPLIRLVVHPEGLRTYYLAYPLLQPLQVPMARENLED